MRRAGNYILLTAIALVFVGPFLLLLSAGLKPSSQAVFSFPPDIIPRPPVLDWVKEAWTVIPYPRYLLNSVIYVAVMVPLYVLVSALCAYPLARTSFRGRNLIFMAILSTMFLPGEVMLIPRFLVVSQLGLADTFAGVILPGLLSAFGIFLLRQTFANVPREIVDAARTDGCHELRIFWHVMLPASRPTLAILAILGFVSVWNSFIWPLVVLKDSAKFPIALGIAYLSGVTGTDVRSLAAGTIISIVPVVVVFMLMQRHVLEGMRGAVKG
ncbi:carbohydrate ABC transporter permease [Nonomuraea muscovyensis]|jgi:putative chitobiose transport system permease protein|uniref:Putative chitobiose transport system permease protein n=1 Tax=Nonomuraea muscovyensis TaxID=1124761 RepID=A0A7X0BW79_9ACTN|nr:carbohydrate ABC transporter permease [Nonomuraea muscovyensis]MBB6343738.1 putative chitobiose transport system permease protein [Nonomuraea muscovyensis]MDF2704607.1 transporter permease subunit [Nonomuraea muscovyensis]